MALGDFPVDLNFKRKPLAPGERYQRPLDGDPGRCQSKRRRLDEQCGKWALKGGIYCRTHSGPVKRFGKKGRHMGLYRDRAGQKLRDLLEAASKNTEARLSLAEEVDMARIIASKYVRMYEAVVLEASDKTKEKDDYKELVGRATRGLKESLKFVSDIVAQMAKISALTENNLGVDQQQYVCDQISKIIEDSLSDQPDLKEKVIKAFDEIVLPTKDIGTMITIN